MLSRKLQVKAVLGASAAVHGFQLFFMIKQTCVRKEFRSLRAFFYAGTAFDARMPGVLVQSFLSIAPIGHTSAQNPHWVQALVVTGFTLRMSMESP